MRNKAIAMMVSALMVVVGVVMPSGVADAHNYDGYSIIYCTAYLPGDEALLHSWAYSLEPGYLNYVCTSTGFFTRWQYFVRRNMSNNTHSMASLYQDCNIVNCEPHGVGT